MILIGYSGHAFVIYGILRSIGKEVTGYCDSSEKSFNPFKLPYLGNEQVAITTLKANSFFIAIGDNAIREKVFMKLSAQNLFPQNAIHASSVVDDSVMISQHGVMIAANATINPLVKIGAGVICNTSCSIDHECVLEDFVHIGPGAVLCGNVKVGSKSFIGANAVVRQGITIGSNAMIGAGAVVVKDVPDNTTVIGVPAK